MQEKKIPEPGSWGTKRGKGGEEVMFQVVAVHHGKEDIAVRRFGNEWVGDQPILGRLSTIDFKTWQTARYQPCEAPLPPVPDMLNREDAKARLVALGVDPVDEVLADPRGEIAGLEADPGLSDTDRAEDMFYNILRAHVRWLDAQKPAEPTAPNMAPASLSEIAALKSEIAALRGAVETLKAEVLAAVQSGQRALPFEAAA
jgi:uncharacterized small protein (DUF1192 family)